MRLAALALGLAAPCLAQPASLQKRVEARLREAGPGPRFGLVVTDDTGREVVAIAPDQRFIPASNTKIFTTAAAFATLPALDQPDMDGATGVRLEGRGRRADVVLVGRGGARLSSAPDCRVDCLATLADAVAARTRTVRNVVGDATHFPDERWSPGMSWNNIPTRSGTAIAALAVNDNEASIRVTPGAAGSAPTLDAEPYFNITNRATTATGATALLADRLPGSRELTVSGTIAAGGAAETLRLGIDDPAHYAAWTFQRMLQARGVRVTGAVIARYRSGSAGIPNTPLLAQTSAAPLAEDLAVINKASQNVHAELLLRRLGRLDGDGSIANGLEIVHAMAKRAGIPRAAYDLSDGSGMSSYNRVSPRGMVTLLRWSAAQPWSASFRATLPIGGVDGTLSRRFVGTSLAGRIFAKTGTLNASAALAGYITAKSGRTLTFAAYANDVPEGVPATAAIDAVLEMIAAAH